MELYHLRSFVAIAEEQNLTRAAKRLFLSQPAISAQIKSLEEELGVSLFDRTSKGMQLSAAGEDLQEDVYGILESVERMQQKARSRHHQIAGAIRFGLNGDYDIVRIPEFLNLINEISSSIDLRFYQGNSGDILLDVQHGDLDIGTILGGNTHAEVELDSLAQVTFCIAGTYEWKSELENATPEKLAKFPWIWPAKQCPCYEYVRDFSTKYGYELPHRVHANANPIVDSLIYSGSGLGLIRKEKAMVAEKEKKLYIWKKEEIDFQFSLAYLKRRAEDPLIRSVRQVMHSIWDNSESNTSKEPSKVTKKSTKKKN